MAVEAIKEQISEQVGRLLPTPPSGPAVQGGTILDYRVGPSTAAATTSLPGVGVTPASDVWARVQYASVGAPPTGTVTQDVNQVYTFYLVAKAGVPFFPVV